MVNSAPMDQDDFRTSDRTDKIHSPESRSNRRNQPHQLDQVHSPGSGLSFSSFVERHFIPEHIAYKSLSGRTHYSAILKHVIAPEEVSRIFGVDSPTAKHSLKTDPGWPYLGALPLSEIRSADVEQLMSAALKKGYSTQTALHIRNVVRATFEHARKENFVITNPAAGVTLAAMVRKDAYVPTLAEIKAVLDAMRYPEKEMTLFAVLTDMTMGEICGLQWKRVNLTDTWSTADVEPIPPWHLAIRVQWRRGELTETASNKRHRNVPVPALSLARFVSVESARLLYQSR